MTDERATDLSRDWNLLHISNNAVKIQYFRLNASHNFFRILTAAAVIVSCIHKARMEMEGRKEGRKGLIVLPQSLSRYFMDPQDEDDEEWE